MYNNNNLYVILIALTTLYLLITAYGSYQIKANYFIRSINETTSDGIVLTFDDGPAADTTVKILNILELANVKATFFVIGKKAEKNPEIIKKIYDAGHIIGNHSYSHHAGIGLFSKEKLIADVNQCSATIQQITGEKPTFFRPPFGVTNPRYQKLLQATGLTSIGWTIRSYDTSAKNEQKLLNRTTSQLKPGCIVLLHDTKEITLAILPALLNYCKRNNIPIKSLKETIKN